MSRKHKKTKKVQKTKRNMSKYKKGRKQSVEQSVERVEIDKEEGS